MPGISNSDMAAALCLASVAQAFHTYRTNLSPFTKDFRVWGAQIEISSIYLRLQYCSFSFSGPGTSSDEGKRHLLSDKVSASKTTKESQAKQNLPQPQTASLAGSRSSL